MHRLFGLMALAAAAIGLYLLFAPDAGPTAATSLGAETAPLTYGGWALGLIMGLALAFLAGIDWANLPARVVAWIRLQRRRLWLAMLGGVFAGILLLF
jgi:hypothetical protein